MTIVGSRIVNFHYKFPIFYPKFQRKQITIFDFCFHKSVIDFFLMSKYATCDNHKLNQQ